MLSYLLVKTSRHMKSKLDQGLKPLGITASQFSVINQVDMMDEPVLAYKIAEAIGSDRPTLSGIVKRLEKMAVLKSVKSEEDGRSYCLSLTKNGLSLLKDARLIADELSQDLFKNFSSEDKTNLENYLHRIEASLEA